MKHLLTLVFLFLFFLQLSAQNFWTGNGNDQQWHTSANWSQGVPALSSDAVLTAAGTVYVSQISEARSIEVNGGSSLIVNSLLEVLGNPTGGGQVHGIRNNNVVTNNGTIFIGKVASGTGFLINGIYNNGIFTNNGTIGFQKTFSASAIRNNTNKSFINNGMIDCYTGSISLNFIDNRGDFTNDGSMNLTANTLQDAIDCTSNSTFTNGHCASLKIDNGKIISGGIIDNLGMVFIDASGVSSINNNTGIVYELVSGTITNNTNTGVITSNEDAYFWHGCISSNINTVGNYFTNQEMIFANSNEYIYYPNISGGYNQPIGNNITSCSTCTIHVLDNGDLTINGTLNALGNLLVYGDYIGGTVNSNGNVAINGGTMDLSGATSIDNSGGQFTLDNCSELTLSGKLINSSSFVNTESIVYTTSSSTQQINTTIKNGGLFIDESNVFDVSDFNINNALIQGFIAFEGASIQQFILGDNPNSVTLLDNKLYFANTNNEIANYNPSSNMLNLISPLANGNHTSSGKLEISNCDIFPFELNIKIIPNPDFDG
ncbi:MAG: hypothetical protein V3V14_05785, partial [Saprospiraceae bacterium]